MPTNPIPLQTAERVVQPIMLDVYDRVQSASLMPTIATTPEQPTNARGVVPNTYRLEWLSFFPELHEWVGNRIIQGSALEGADVKVKPYEISWKVYTDPRDHEGFAAELATAAGKATAAYPEGIFQRAMDLLRSNPTSSVDGQNLFDTDHPKPDGSLASNVVIPSPLAAGGNPTLLEMSGWLNEVVDRIRRNAIVARRWQRTADLPEIVVMLDNTNYRHRLEELNRLEYLDTTRTLANLWRGKIEILANLASTAESLNFDVLLRDDSGPKPLFFADVQPPSQLRINEANQFNARHTEVGTDAWYVLEPGFWHNCARGQEGGGG